MNQAERRSLDAQIAAFNEERARQKAECVQMTSALGLKVGDRATFGWKWRNPDRHWWQLWKPRFVPMPPFRVVSVTHSELKL